MEKQITIILNDEGVLVQSNGFDNKYQLLGVLKVAMMTLEYPVFKSIEDSYQVSADIPSPTSSGE